MCEQPNVVTSVQTLNSPDFSPLRCSRVSGELVLGVGVGAVGEVGEDQVWESDGAPVKAFKSLCFFCTFLAFAFDLFHVLIHLKSLDQIITLLYNNIRCVPNHIFLYLMLIYSIVKHKYFESISAQSTFTVRSLQKCDALFAHSEQSNNCW